jgi:hypothetical protein
LDDEKSAWSEKPPHRLLVDRSASETAEDDRARRGAGFVSTSVQHDAGPHRGRFRGLAKCVTVTHQRLNERFARCLFQLFAALWMRRINRAITSSTPGGKQVCPEAFLSAV